MPAIDVHHDMDELTITVLAEFDTSPQRLWELHTQPASLEDWFAESVSHLALEPRGHVHYTLKSVDGTLTHQYWEFIEIHPEEFLYFERGLSDETRRIGRKTARHRTRFVPTERGATLDVLMRYPTQEALQQALDEDTPDQAHALMVRLGEVAGR